MEMVSAVSAIVFPQANVSIIAFVDVGVKDIADVRSHNKGNVAQGIN